MIKERAKRRGKIIYYNNITGIIAANNEELLFHKKDIKHIINQSYVGIGDLVDREVEFNIENYNGTPLVRNITVLSKSYSKK